MTTTPAPSTRRFSRPVRRAVTDRQLTRLRRDRIGFVFQAFNLLPTMTALANILLPASLAGRKPDLDRLDRGWRTGGLPTRRAIRRTAGTCLVDGHVVPVSFGGSPAWLGPPVSLVGAGSGG